MGSIIEQIFQINGDLLLIHACQLLLAFVLVLPIGFNRETNFEGVGLRTFPLVSLASCSFVLLGYALTNEDANAVARIISGVITGVGFIGGGAILKDGANVQGTSTAAAIWSAGSIGVAIAMRHTEIALLVSVFTFAIFFFADPVKGKIKETKGDE